MYTDSSTGKNYYHNRTTGGTSWERPAAFTVPQKKQGSFSRWLTGVKYEVVGQVRPSAVARSEVLLVGGRRRLVELKNGRFTIHESEIPSQPAARFEVDISYCLIEYGRGRDSDFQVPLNAFLVTIDPEIVNKEFDRMNANGNGGSVVWMQGLYGADVGHTKHTGRGVTYQPILLQCDESNFNLWRQALGSASTGARNWAYVNHEVTDSIDSIRRNYRS